MVLSANNHLSWTIFTEEQPYVCLLCHQIQHQHLIVINIFLLSKFTLPFGFISYSFKILPIMVMDLGCSRLQHNGQFSNFAPNVRQQGYYENSWVGLVCSHEMKQIGFHAGIGYGRIWNEFESNYLQKIIKKSY